MKDKITTLRIPEDQAKRLAKATDRGKNPLAPSVTQVLLMGLTMALKEIEAK